jgi:hypothetical protein
VLSSFGSSCSFEARQGSPSPGLRIQTDQSVIV